MRGFQITGALFIFVGSCAIANMLLAHDEPLGDAFAESGAAGGFEVEIVVPEVRTNKRSKSEDYAAKEGEACTTGCSLAKHAIAEFTVDNFRDALRNYAEFAPWQESEPLDTLLFYNKRTLEYLDSEGSEPLSPEHVAFLRRELARENAIVTIRMVDEHGVTRVTYGPEKVPLGQKQHLAPTEVGNLFAMEFNGTVMRTGLYHLWSRY